MSSRNAHEFTRGEFGLRVQALFDTHLAYYYVFLLLLLAVQAGLYLMLRSPAGLYLQAIRDDETAAASRGVNVVFWKTMAFAISGAICGIAGALNVHFAEIASPQLGHIFETGLVLASAVIGGMGTMVGPLIGAFLVEITSEQFRALGLNHMLFFAFMVIVIVAPSARGSGAWSCARCGRWRAGRPRARRGRRRPVARELPRDRRGQPPVRRPARRRSASRCASSEGEMVGLIGPNGSGKTTLLNVLTGHYAPDAGSVRLEGRPIHGLRPNQIARLGIARMFQLTRLFRRLSTLDNLIIAGCAAGSATTRRRRAPMP